jgi:hypothetical protein
MKYLFAKVNDLHNKLGEKHEVITKTWVLTAVGRKLSEREILNFRDIRIFRYSLIHSNICLSNK